MKKVPHKYGFTLIELVLVAAILVVIGLAVYGTFANGISIWKQVTEESATEDVNLFFEKISFELRNSFKLTDLRFQGNRGKVSFPALVKYKDKGGLRNSIGRVSYYLDRKKKALIRKEEDYSEVFRKKKGSTQILFENIDSLQFKYYIYDEQRKKYSWVTSWQEEDETFGIQVEESLPLIVRIEIGISKDKEEQIFVKTVQMPTGCCWPFAEEEQ